MNYPKYKPNDVIVIKNNKWNCITIGKKYTIEGLNPTIKSPYYNIVGVVGDFYYKFLEESSELDKYFLREKKLKRILK